MSLRKVVVMKREVRVRTWYLDHEDFAPIWLGKCTAWLDILDWSVGDVVEIVLREDTSRRILKSVTHIRKSDGWSVLSFSRGRFGSSRTKREYRRNKGHAFLDVASRSLAL